MQDKPKFIFNQGTGKFEGLTPEDDVKIEDLKKAQWYLNKLIEVYDGKS